MRSTQHSSLLLFPSVAMMLGLGIAASAHEVDQAGPRTHTELTTVVTKVESGVIFLKPTKGLRNRAISLKKAERMGLADPKAGDEVTVLVDEGNILLDVHKKGMPPAGHRLLTGTLSYADPFWEVVELATPEEHQTFGVDSLAASKLSILKEGAPVRLELDEDNMVIDIHPTH
jgi:hypothetical protein